MNAPQQIINNAAIHFENANRLLYEIVHPNNVKELERQQKEIIFYAYGELLRDNHLLQNIFYDPNMDENTKNQAADLLEHLLGIEPNSGLLWDLRVKISEIKKQIYRELNKRDAAGGKRRKRSTRRRHKKNKTRRFRTRL